MGWVREEPEVGIKDHESEVILEEEEEEEIATESDYQA